jgi:hypothetical protein
MDRWGGPFFSWQQQWIWMESGNRDTRLDWARAHATKEQMDAVPEKERPSFANYRRTHTPEQMQERLVGGWSEVWGDFMNPVREARTGGVFRREMDFLSIRGIYPLAVLVILTGAGFLVLSRWKAVDRDGLRLPAGTGAAALFTVTACAGYGVWYAWCSPFSVSGLAVLYLPLMFSLTKGADNLMVLARMRGAPRWTWQVYQVLLWVLVAGAAAGAIETIWN